MLDKLLHHKLLTEGHEGQGVITEQNVEGTMSSGAFISSFIIGVKGHFKFPDGSEGEFHSVGLTTSKVGDIDAGTIVPVRYDPDHKHVALDVPKLEEMHKAKRQEASDSLDDRQQADIAAADAAVAKRSEGSQHRPPADGGGGETLPGLEAS